MKGKKKKSIKVGPEGIGYIKASFNNTIITLTDKFGNAISWCSAGAMGFKGSRKNTPFAATQAAQKAAEDAISFNIVKKGSEVLIEEFPSNEDFIDTKEKIESLQRDMLDFNNLFSNHHQNDQYRLDGIEMLNNYWKYFSDNKDLVVFSDFLKSKQRKLN